MKLTKTKLKQLIREELGGDYIVDQPVQAITEEDFRRYKDACDTIVELSDEMFQEMHRLQNSPGSHAISELEDQAELVRDVLSQEQTTDRWS
jgi:hypothetical protein